LPRTAGYAQLQRPQMVPKVNETMNMLISDEPQTAELAPALVELLVSQVDALPMRFPLAEGKSTVGSSPSCQIRLGAPSVRPLQCLIVRKGQAFTVTRWAAGVQLNGNDFTTSPLNTGDVLSIGDMRLELVDSDAQVRQRELIEPSPVSLIDEVEAQVAAEVAITEVLPPTTEQQPITVTADLTKLRTANQQARRRFRTLVGALRELRDEAHGLDKQVCLLNEQLQSAQQTQERLSAELDQSQAIATERESQIGEELDRAIAELTASYTKADAASQEIESLRQRNQHVQEQIDTLTAELASLRELCSGHEAEKQQFEQQLTDREMQLSHVRNEIAELQKSFESSVNELQHQNESLQEQLTDVQRDREREFSELQQGMEASVVELHEQNEALRGQFEELNAARDNQIAELQGLNEALQADISTIAGDRDQRIADFETLRATLENELAFIVEQRDQQLSELHHLNESLKVDAGSAIADRDQKIAELHVQLDSLQANQTATIGERDQQLAELNSRYDALQVELTAAIAERDRNLQELRDAMEMTIRELRAEAEQLTQQLTEQAAERDRTIAEMEQAHRTALDELTKQIETLHQELFQANNLRETQVSALQTELEQARHALAEAERLRELPDPEKIELENDLQAVRSERQKLAEEKHHLALQLEDAEKRSKLLEIDVRSVNAEWQRTQNTVAKLQDELLTTQAQAADLDAKLCDFQCSADIDRAVDSDEFAGSLAAMRTELEHRQQALDESKANSEQLQKQLTTAEQELAASQQNVAVLKQQIVDLQASTVELENERTHLNAILEERATQITALKETAAEAQQVFTSELAARDEYVTQLDAQLAGARNDLSNAELAAKAQLAELTQQLTTQKDAALDADNERAHLISAIKDCETRIAALTAAETESQRSNAVELADRDSRIKALAAELEVMRQSLNSAASEGDAHLTELTAALAQAEQKLVCEMQAKEKLTVEHAAELSQLQEAIKFELTTRDEQIANLSAQLEQLRDSANTEQSTLQQASDALQEQLLAAQENASLELACREEQINELTRDLHQTQNQLVECASQGERLAELYRQAQADLTALMAATPTQLPVAATSEVDLTEALNESTADDLVTEEPPHLDDPRDNDTPRLERALATLTSEPEVDEASTKTVPFQPESFIDRYSHIFDEETEAHSSITPMAPGVIDPAPRLNDFVDDDSAALEAYMANMMRRVRGETSSDTVVPPVTAEPAAELPIFSNPASRMNTLTQRVADASLVDSSESAEENLICLNELKQTSQKPPLPTSLSAMRELANSSARQAIAKHRKRRHFEGALSKLLVSGIAGATAAYMLFTADSYSSTYFLAGCGVAIVSGYWGVKLLGIVLEIIRDGIHRESSPAELDDSTDPLPIDGVSH
jgi:chromosome segregation ATPase